MSLFQTCLSSCYFPLEGLQHNVSFTMTAFACIVRFRGSLSSATSQKFFIARDDERKEVELSPIHLSVPAQIIGSRMERR